MKCTKHPRYQAKQPPRGYGSDHYCKKCGQIWEATEAYTDWETFWSEVKRGTFWESEYLDELKTIKTPTICRFIKRALNTKVKDLDKIDAEAYEACAKKLGFEDEI
jgi:hypothetical protein